MLEQSVHRFQTIEPRNLRGEQGCLVILPRREMGRMERYGYCDVTNLLIQCLVHQVPQRPGKVGSPAVLETHDDGPDWLFVER